MWQLSQAWPHSLPSPASFLVGLSVGLGPRGAYQVHLIHWAPLYEMGLSWRQRRRGKKGLIEFGLGPAPSPAGLLMFGGDFHITLKLLVFLPRLSLLPRVEDLKLKAALKMGNEANSISGACALCVCVCACAYMCAHACVSMMAFGSLLTPCHRDHSAEEIPKDWLDTRRGVLGRKWSAPV